MDLPNGKFNPDNINNWQHAAMYFAFMISGIVDLCALYGGLPAGAGQVRGSL